MLHQSTYMKSVNTSLLILSILCLIHRSLNRALLACHKCPKKKRLDRATCVNVYHPLVLVLNTPSPDTPFLLKVKVSPNYAFLVYAFTTAGMLVSDPFSTPPTKNAVTLHCSILYSDSARLKGMSDRRVPP